MKDIFIKDAMHQGNCISLLVAGNDVKVVTTAPRGDVIMINGRGLEAVPAFWETHAHFRDPGNSDAEDMLSGARAAAAGGYGVVFCEPNTQPVLDSVAAIQAFNRRVDELAIPISVYPKAALTIGQHGTELVDIESLAAEVSIFSTDGEPVVDRDLLAEAFMRVCNANPDRICQIHAHCEETPRSHAKVVAVLGDGPYLARETEIVRLHLEALEAAGCGWLRIQHVSLPETVQLVAEFAERVRANADLVPKLVEMEVTPHHIRFCRDDIPSHDDQADANWKMNPPLRSHEAMLGIRSHLRTMQYIATDHAPHTSASKQLGWDAAPFGVIGLETAFGALASFEDSPDRDWQRSMLVDRLTPDAKILSPDSEKFRFGITLIDWDAVWTVDPSKFYSKSRNCPFAGMTLKGKPMYTIANGKLVMAEGEVLF